MAKKITAPKNAEELNDFLSQTLADVRNSEINTEEAETIAKVADKINKNVLNQILNKKATTDKIIEIKFLTT